jgi:hypothetical protein
MHLCAYLSNLIFLMFFGNKQGSILLGHLVQSTVQKTAKLWTGKISEIIYLTVHKIVYVW